MLSLIQNVKTPLEAALSFFVFPGSWLVNFLLARRCWRHEGFHQLIQAAPGRGKPQGRHPETSQSAHTGLIASPPPMPADFLTGIVAFRPHGTAVSI